MSAPAPRAHDADVRPWALVPAKSFTRAKARLASLLDEPARAALARGFLAHVLDAVRASDAVVRTMVVTDCDEVTAVAQAAGTLVVRDEATSLAAIVDAALARLDALGARGVIVLMSDLPDLAPRDVADLARALVGADVAIAPDLQRAGTNALALRSPRAMPTCFGHADSFARHVARAAEMRLGVAVHASERLGFDVDEPGDLATLRARRRVSAA